CITGLSSRHVGERFQHTLETIAKYFKLVLIKFSSDPFYSSQVKFPNLTTPPSETITCDPRFIFFCDCISAVNGMHIRAYVPLEEQ
ncbi:hypothetical protein M404DRAFT_47221, partial [Pisolithus tinctorius Marx 270]